MNERPTLLKPVGPASLADEDDFRLGDILVRPSLREVCRGETREILEPRVMQVLVALAQAKGAVVSRDELIRQCWGGRIVGEDAINRCVSKIRQIAELGGNRTFEIETIPRVGYRLLRVQPAGHSAPEVPSLPLRTETTARQPGADKPTAARAIPNKFILYAVLGVTIVAAIGAALVLMPKPAQEWAVMESHQPFIATQDIERFPSFSPDGTMIAYSRGKNVWNRQIFLQLLRGGDPLQLTHDMWDATTPAFSPDGTSVVYSGFQEKQPCRIMLAQIPSGPSREIGRCRSVERTSFSWDHSGHALFFYDRFNANQFLHIMRYNIDTGTMTEVTRSGASGSFADFQPSVSPDGKTILFMRYVKGDRMQVALRELKSGSERILVDDDADKYAAWSEDSSTVFVASNKGSDSSLWAYPASGAAPWRITSNARPMEFLSSGPDGLLAVELKNRTTELAVASSAANAAPRSLAASGLNGCSFDYAPDGTLALIANNGESPIIAVGIPGHLHEVVRLKGASPCGIHWSPDGTKLAFASKADSSFRISVVDRDGMPTAQLPFPSRDIGYFEWSPDGREILQSRLDAQGWRLWRVDVAPPFRAVPVLPHGWDWVHMRNGMMFGVKPGSPGIWRIDGIPKRLTDWPSPEYPWAWTMAGDKLVYADFFSHPGQRLIIAQPIAGGPRTIIGYANDMDVYSLLAFDPTNGQVTYNRVLRDDPDIGWLRLTRK